MTDGVTLVGWFADYRDTITTYAGWDLKTGKLKWGPESTATYSSLSIGDGAVLITGGPALIALDPATGKQKWSTKVPLAAEDETLVYNGVAYTEAGRYSMATGQYLGALQLPRNDGGMRMAYGGGCILAQVLGTVACMDPTTGVQIWQRTLNIIGPNTTPPVYSNGRVYVYNYVTRQPDVLDVVTVPLAGHAQVPLAVGDSLSYNLQTNGMSQAIHVVAQHVPDGKAAWTYTLPVAKDGYHVTVIQMVLSNSVLYVTGMSLDKMSLIDIYALDANTGRLPGVLTRLQGSISCTRSATSPSARPTLRYGQTSEVAIPAWHRSTSCAWPAERCARARWTPETDAAGRHCTDSAQAIRGSDGRRTQDRHPAARTPWCVADIH